jgi:tRNA threonylcarbamoyladenosine biosynthesis protein TsaB
MKILALDAATEACSAALLCDQELSERYEVIGRGHAERLLPMADELMRGAGLATSDLDGVAFGRGPGGFTGLRIAAGIAQGLAAGARRPVLPVSNLAAVAALAARLHGVARVLVAMDARMGQVYWAAFDCGDGVPRPSSGEFVTDPARISLSAGPGWFGAGHGFAAYPEISARFSAELAGIDATLLPRAGDIARIAEVDFTAGRALDPAKALPVYLRDEVVHQR